MESQEFKSSVPSFEPELSPRELARKKKREYDVARKAKINFMEELGKEATYLAWKKTEIAESEKGKELLVPPIVDTESAKERMGNIVPTERVLLEYVLGGHRKMRHFWAKQVFDNFAQPILDYENLKKEIEENSQSNTKKKEALRELEAQKQAAEARLSKLPDWNSGASEEEKREYIGCLEKLLGHASF